MRIKHRRKNKIARTKVIALITVVMMLVSLTSMAAAFMDYEVNAVLSEYVQNEYDVDIELPIAELPVLEVPKYDNDNSSYEQSEYGYSYGYGEYDEYYEYESDEFYECKCVCDYYDYNYTCECEYCECNYEDDYVGIVALTTHTVSTWAELLEAFSMAPTGMPVAGDYIVEVTADITMNNQIAVLEGRNVTLRSTGGYTLTRSTGSARHFVLLNSTLILEDITLCGDGANLLGTNRGGVVINGHLIMRNGAIITGNSQNSGGGVLVGTDDTLTMEGGEISGNAASVFGGGVTTTGTGVINMHDGIISNNVAPVAGGVYVAWNGIFTMHGGIIYGNQALASSGGGVHSGSVIGNSTFIMHGGVISGNVASQSGGGVSTSATFIMYGGEITGNFANFGGGLASGGRSTLSSTIHNGIISNNTAAIIGGGISHTDGILNINNGTISGNKANGVDVVNGGGGLSWMVEEDITNITIASTVIFSNNTAATGLRIDDSLNRTHNLEANGRINPGDWTGRPDVPHAFNNNDIRTINEVIDLTYHTVTFNLLGGIGNFPTQTIPNNGTATAPTTEPTRAGHSFVGWFTQAEGGVQFNFNTPITANTIIHARWVVDETQFEPCCYYCCLGYYDCEDSCDCDCDYEVTEAPQPTPSPAPPPPTGGNQQGGLPATGIENNITLWSVLLSLSLFAITGTTMWIMRIVKKKQS